MKRVYILILLMLWITGCSAPPASAPAVPPPATETPLPIPPKAASTASPVPLTATPPSSPTPFVPKATIKIAVQAPLSGDLAPGAVEVKLGAELAIAQLSDSLNQLGYQVELASFDDRNDTGTGISTAKEIAADPTVLCGVGPYTSRMLTQVKEIYHKAGLPFISPSASAAFATQSGYAEINRLLGRHDGEAEAGALFAQAQGYERVLVINGDRDYERFVAYHFRDEATRLGILVVGSQSLDDIQGSKGMDSLKAANADLVYFSTLDVRQAGAYFRAARAAGYTGAFLGSEGIASSSLLEFAGPLLIEDGGMYYSASMLPVSRYTAAENFVKDFAASNGHAPRSFAAHAYDAAAICLRSIEDASKAIGGDLPTRAEVAKAIRALQDYQGITYVYTFNQNGDPDPAPYFLIRVVSADPNAWDQNPVVNTYEVSPPR